MEKCYLFLEWIKIAGLAFIFVALLIIYARKVGIKSLISFVGSIIIIWEYLIPSLRKERISL